MDSSEMLIQLSKHSPSSLKTLGGAFVSLDVHQQAIEMSFDIDDRFCHSGNVVQGGFITAMLDAAMAYAAIGSFGLDIRVPTLEIKVSFISPGNPGRLIARGSIVHAGRSTLFLTAQLHQLGRLVATATSTAKLVRTK